MDLKATSTVMTLLSVAALLETGGDAIIRAGLGVPNPFVRAVLFLVGAVILFTYGYLVNASSWDFGRLLGIYIVFFFVVAQVLSWAVFHHQPSRAILLGGALIVPGGIIIAVNP